MDRRSRERRSLPVLPAAPGPGRGSGPGAGVRTGDGAERASDAARAASGAAADGARARVRIGLVTLGCDKNTVDSERVMARLFGEGAEVSVSIEDADVVVVNTCGFIDAAKDESIETILEAARLKEAGAVRAVVAMGCLVQRYRDELAAEMPEVDLFLGLTETDRLVPALRERGLLPKPGDFVPNMERPLRVLTTGTPHTSHLKIGEGCDHSCAFCAIPLMRGKFRSTPIDRLVREAQELEAQGVVELNIVSQDTTWYGRDWLRGHDPNEDGDYFLGRFFEGMSGPAPRSRSPSPSPKRGAGKRRGYLPDLLDALLDETTVPWLRLFYMYPSGIYPELVETIAGADRIVPYLDMPIQHGSDAVLKRMRRPERRATILERVGWLRDAVPGLALRSTVIVGFPGETEAEFEQMLELLEEIRFDHLGAFTYSVEEGTRAAAMPGRVPETVKRERLERVLDLQRAIAAERNEAWIGRETDVLVDRRARDGEPGGLVGRTAAQAYEIDGVVRLDGGADAEPGEFVRARITGVDERDLFAEIAGDG